MDIRYLNSPSIYCNPHLFQLYSKIPEGHYELAYVISYKRFNKIVFNLILLSKNGKILPLLFCQVQKDNFLFPNLFASVSNSKEIIISIKNIINSLDNNPNLGVRPFVIPVKPINIPLLEKFTRGLTNPERAPFLLFSDICTIERAVLCYHFWKILAENNKKILDFGCGTGIGSLILSKETSNEIIGIDRDPSIIQFTKQLYTPSNLTFTVGDISTLKDFQKFDIVIISEVLEHNTDHRNIIKAVEKVSQKRGEIFISVPNWKWGGMDKNSDHKADWTLKKVLSEFSYRSNVRFFVISHRQNQSEIAYTISQQFSKDAEQFLILYSKPKRKNKFCVRKPSLERILLIAHDAYPFASEYSGVPLITFRQATAIKKLGYQVAILITDAKLKDGFKKEKFDDIVFYKIPRLERWWEFLEDLFSPDVIRPYLSTVEEIIWDFDPQIAQVNINAFMSPRIMKFLHDNYVKVVRSFADFDDLCFRTTPMQLERRKLCAGPLNIAKCVECLSSTMNLDINPYHKIIRQSYLAQRIFARWQYIKFIYKNYVDAFVFTNQSFANYMRRFIKIPPKKIVIIPRGISTIRSKTLKFADRKVIFGFLGALTFRKGIDILLDAINTLRSPNFEVKIWGQWRPEEKHFLSQITGLKRTLGEKIKYYGPYSPQDLDKILEEIHVGIVPSRKETYCIVLREILSKNIPVICTKFLGSDIIKDGFNGFIIDEDPYDLREKMLLFINNPNLVQKMSLNVMNVHIPTLEEEAKALVLLYKSLLTQT